MHGTPTAMCFGTDAPNTSPRLLANVIRHRKDYNGENIRLLSCSTGKIVDGNYCFAEELSNALGVCVEGCICTKAHCSRSTMHTYIIVTIL